MVLVTIMQSAHRFGQPSSDVYESRTRDFEAVVIDDEEVECVIFATDGDAIMTEWIAATNEDSFIELPLS